MMKVRTLIVEDEGLATQRLTDLANTYEWIDVIGTAADGPAGIETIRARRPELVFLDVEMPGCSGLDVLKAVRDVVPVVVFVTAFDEYAVAAFELRALDYILKPVSAGRFSETMARVQRFFSNDNSGMADRALEILTAPPVERMFVRRFGRIVPVAMIDIARFEAKRDYVVAHTLDGGSHLLHTTTNGLLAQLDPVRFVRVHRSHIVNMDHVTHMESHDNTRLALTLVTGETVVASRAKSQELRRAARS